MDAENHFGTGVRPKPRNWMTPLLMALVTVLLGWPLLCFPLGLDQGIYAVAATKMLEGEPLYKGVWDMKSPGIFFMYVLPVAVGGFRVWPIQLVHLALHGLSAAAIFFLMRWWFDRLTAWTGFALFLLLDFAWGTPITNGQPDDWMLPFFLWAIYFVSTGWLLPLPRARWHAFAAGALMGWVLVLRSTMLFACVLLPLVWLPVALDQTAAAEALGLNSQSEQSSLSFFRRAGFMLGFYVLGGLAVGLATLSYFLFTGSLYDLYYSQFIWVRRYAQTVFNWESVTFDSVYALARERYLSYWEKRPLYQYSLAIGLAGLAAWRIVWRRRIPWWGLGIWVVGLGLGFSCYVVQMKFFNYHHWPLLPFLSMAAALGIAALILAGARALWRRGAESEGRLRHAWRACAALVVVALAVLLLESETSARHLRKRQKQALEYATGQVSWTTWVDRFDFHHIYKGIEDRLLANYILEHTREGEEPKVFIWGFRPAIYFYVGTTGPSRFVYNLPLRADWSPPEWLQALEGEVMAEPPDFVVIGKADNFNWVVGNESTSHSSTPAWLRAELDAHFRLVPRLDELSRIELWERVQPTGDD